MMKVRFLKQLLKNIVDYQDNYSLALGKLQLEAMRQKWDKFEQYDQIEFKAFSQNGEDGIIQYLINTINIKNRTFIEFGVENYTEANTRFLLMNNNWSGMVLDGDKKNINYIKTDRFFWKYDLQAREAFITRENINTLLIKNGFDREVGLLSIDVDGNDYWIWEAIECIRPCIVICEYNALFGKNVTISIPYSEKFYRTNAHYSNLYFGASLPALRYLAAEKGYTFVCTNSTGNNAFFVRDDYTKGIKVPNIDEGFNVCKARQSRNENGTLSFLPINEQIKLISELPVVDVKTGEIKSIGEFDI